MLSFASKLSKQKKIAAQVNLSGNAEVAAQQNNAEESIKVQPLADLTHVKAAQIEPQSSSLTTVASKKRPLEQISTVKLNIQRSLASEPTETIQSQKVIVNEVKESRLADQIEDVNRSLAMPQNMQKRRKQDQPKKNTFQSFKMRKSVKTNIKQPFPVDLNSSMQVGTIQDPDEEQNTSILEIQTNQNASEAIPQYSLMTHVRRINSVRTNDQNGSKKSATPYNPLEELDQARFKQVADIKLRKKQEQIDKTYKEYQIVNDTASTPEDWSIKQYFDVQMKIEGQFESQHVNKIFNTLSQRIKQHRYYEFKVCVDDQEKLQNSQMNWFKSCRDVFRQFAQYGQNKDEKNAQAPPFFYIYNQTMTALFKYQDGKQVCQLVPSPSLFQQVQNCPNLKFTIKKFYESTPNGNQQQNQPNQKVDEDDQEEKFELENILANLNEPINMVDGSAFEMDSRYFKLEVQKELKLLCFENKSIHTLFNILINNIAKSIFSDKITRQKSVAQIVSPNPFLNCQFKDLHIIFQDKYEGQYDQGKKGSIPQKQIHYDLKIQGLMFNDLIKDVNQMIIKQMRDLTQKSGQIKTMEAKLTFKSEDLSKVISNQNTQQVAQIYYDIEKQEDLMMRIKFDNF